MLLMIYTTQQSEKCTNTPHGLKEVTKGKCIAFPLNGALCQLNSSNTLKGSIGNKLFRFHGDMWITAVSGCARNVDYR